MIAQQTYPSTHRNYVNATLNRVRRGLRWLVEEGHLQEEVLFAVLATPSLKAYRSPAAERPPVRAVNWADVEAATNAMTPKVRSMVLLQWYTGMRPGEVRTLRVEEVDFEKSVIDKGMNHKNAHRGRRRLIYLGPQSTAILRVWVDLAKAKNRAYIFPSARSPHRPFQPLSYGLQIRKACRAAGVPPWTPNQIRHAYATRVRDALGIDAAQLMLGHAKADVTQVYAEINDTKGRRVASECN